MLSTFSFCKIKVGGGDGVKGQNVTDFHNNPDIQYKLYYVLCRRPFLPPFDSGCTRLEYKGNAIRIQSQTHATIAINQPGRCLIEVIGKAGKEAFQGSVSSVYPYISTDSMIWV